MKKKNLFQIPVNCFGKVELILFHALFSEVINKPHVRFERKFIDEN